MLKTNWILDLIKLHLYRKSCNLTLGMEKERDNFGNFQVKNIML